MIVFMISLCLFLTVPIALFVRDLYIRDRLTRLIAAKYIAMKDVLEKLPTGLDVDEKEILAIANVPSLRVALYLALEEYDRQNLFPCDLLTEEKGAESHLVNWLEFPTELGRPPEDILLMKIVEMDDANVRIHYYAFKFKTSAPSWARKIGWMMGICGPYDYKSLPFDIPSRIFSRFNPLETTTADDEVNWVHKTINPA